MVETETKGSVPSVKEANVLVRANTIVVVKTENLAWRATGTRAEYMCSDGAGLRRERKFRRRNSSFSAPLACGWAQELWLTGQRCQPSRPRR